MTDTTTSVAPPKKRTLFKRAAWQDAPKTENEDIFSHSNEFPDIIAAQIKRKAEDKRKPEASRPRKPSEPHERKRRRVSNEHEQPALSKSGSSSNQRASRTSSKARSRTPLSPLPSHPPPDSLAARYESLAKTASSSVPPKESIVVDLGDTDEEDDSGYVSKPLHDDPAPYHEPWKANYEQDMPIRPFKPAPVVIDDDDDDDEEIEEDPTLALLKARARERHAAKAKAAASTPNGETTKAPAAQLFIQPEMDIANPMMVKVRIDSTIDKARLAWCAKQGFSPEMTRNVFFTWKNTRLYDSTTIKRLGIQVDDSGNVTVEGDSNIYDELNIPKVHVQAWTEELWRQRKKEDAAEAAAKKIAAEAPPVIEERTPTPEPAPNVTKIRLVLKAKGKAEFKLTVNPDTTLTHIAAAYKTKLGIPKSDPITLMFDGERLSPLDTVAGADIEDMDAIEVLFK